MDITADGEHTLGPIPRGQQACVQLTGTFGAGTATIGFIPEGGIFTPYSYDADGTPIEFTAGGFATVWAPYNGVIALDLNGATAPEIEAHVWAVFFPNTRQS